MLLRHWEPPASLGHTLGTPLRPGAEAAFTLPEAQGLWASEVPQSGSVF